MVAHCGLPDAHTLIAELAKVVVALKYSCPACPVVCGVGAWVASAPTVLVLFAALAGGYDPDAAVDTTVFGRAWHGQNPS